MLDGVRRYSTADADIIFQNLRKKVKRNKEVEKLCRGITDDWAREYVQTLDLTDEQIQYILNLENATGYNCSVADLQVVAASLFSNNMEPAFVAGMLGNMCHEGDVGHLENVNAGTNNKYEYWNDINKCSVPREDGGDPYTYKNDFADKYLYDVDFDVYKKLVEQAKNDNPNGDNAIGCGCAQWTQRGRHDLLMSYYEAADAEGDHNGQLSYEECLIAETLCMGYELTHNYTDENKNWYSYKTQVTEKWTDDWKEDGAIINTAESASDAAEIICDKYENPDPNNSHIDERKADAESLFNVMIGED